MRHAFKTENDVTLIMWCEHTSNVKLLGLIDFRVLSLPWFRIVFNVT